MGFPTIVMYTGLFVVAMVIVLGIGASYQNYVTESQSIINAQKDYRLTAGLEILNTSYSDNVTTAYLDNTGQEKLDLETLDLYLDGVFIPRNSSNKTTKIVTDALNPGLWDPGEKVVVNITMELETGIKTLVVSDGASPESHNVIVGIVEEETLISNAGLWNPIMGGNLLTAGELLAINNKLGTNISLNTSNMSAGLEIEDPTFTPLRIEDVIIEVDYRADTIGAGDFMISAHNLSYDGTLLCNDSYDSVTGITTISLPCSVTNLENLYIVLNTTGNEVIIDYVRVNATYLR